MAIIRKSLEEIKANPPPFDRAKIEATAEEDIRRNMIEDGEDPDALLGDFAPSAKTLRLQLGMTQKEFAKALRIPITTLQNWEQHRTEPEPAAKALLRVLAKNPQAVLEALA